MCILTLKDQRFLAVELVADDLADLPALHHFPHLLHACPLDTIGLTRKKDDFGQRCGPLDAVKIIMGIPVTIGTDEFKFIFFRFDARFLKEFPNNGLPAGLASLRGTSRIFPGAGKALARCPAGQEQVALTVVNPDADHKAVLPRLPAGTAAMNSAGKIAVFVVNIIKFHRVHLLTLFYIL